MLEQLPQLRAECAKCVGLCCVALTLTASADFAIDKPAGTPCPNLGPDFGCGIHAHLRERGFRGCTVFDCFGAGQQVVQVTFGGRSWRQDPQLAGEMFASFDVMRHLHEMLWYLTCAQDAVPGATMRGELDRALADTVRLTGRPAADLLALDIAAHRERIGALLERAGELVRATARVRWPELSEPANRQRTDLVGADLRGADLRGVTLRGAYLIAADLRSADLRLADLLGADLRDADLSGADLTEALFLSQMQLDSARGDAATRVPASLTRPAHWPRTSGGQ